MINQTNSMRLKQGVSIYAMAAFYCFAGLNHFVQPEFYLPLIPDYLPWEVFVNYASGALELIIGIGLFFPFSRKAASIALIILLALFIPSHVHFIVIGSCVEDGLCVPAWVAWLRLMVIHPLLMYWAYYVSKIKSNGK